jgi:hypothetical protein
MKKILFFMLTLVTTFCVNFSGFCQEEIIDYSFSGEIFEKVIDGKCYLKPGVVVVDSSGIFLIFQGQLVSIPGIQADSEGVYMKQMPGVCSWCGYPMKNPFECSNTLCETNTRRR